jgi:hypothetical protein
MSGSVDPFDTAWFRDWLDNRAPQFALNSICGQLELSFGFGHATPYAVRLFDGQCMCPTLGDHWAAAAYQLCVAFAGGTSTSAFTVGREER